jgi:hypothetical protein
MLTFLRRTHSFSWLVYAGRTAKATGRNQRSVGINPGIDPLEAVRGGRDQPSASRL